MSHHHDPLDHEHYLNVSYGVKSWLLTRDHKRIALLYLISITLFFFSADSLPCSSDWSC
jgi:hypothetical protein